MAANEQPPDDGRPMSRRLRGALIVYLLGVGIFLVYALLRLNAVDFPDVALAIEAPQLASAQQPAGDTPSTGSQSPAGQRPTASGPPPSGEAPPAEEKPPADGQPPGGAPGQGQPGNGGALVLTDAFPYLRGGLVPQYEIAVYGSGFNERSQVRLNGRSRVPRTPPEGNLIRVVPTPADLVGSGFLVIDVINPAAAGAGPAADAVSNSLALPIAPPKRTLRLLWREWAISREMQIILMVLFAGALGGLVHGVKSLADYIGNRTAITSWASWYVTRPFLGGALALIVYAVLRGGFLTGTPADVRVVNPFGAIAVAALVGMFADKAAQKLAEVFDTLFKAEDRRSGTLAAPVIDRIDPPTVRTGTTAAVDLKIIGDRLSATRTVRIDGKERAPDKVSDKEVAVKLQPEDMATSGQLSISVVTAGATSPSVKLFVSDIEITTTTLPPGKVGDDYPNTTLAVTGGTPPHRWSLDGAPAGLKIDRASGAITGKPTKAGEVKVTATVIDSVGASTTTEFVVSIAP